METSPAESNQEVNHAIADNEQTNSQQLSEEIKTEHTLYSEPIAQIGNFTVTNSLLNSWLAVIVVILLALAIRKKIKLVPSGIQNFFESIVELFLGLFLFFTKLFEVCFTYFSVYAFSSIYNL